MDTQRFNHIVKYELGQIETLLVTKAKEYASDVDRLHNFNAAAELGGDTPLQALAGFMRKHTVSIYDMLYSGDPDQYSKEMWDEKVRDNLAYLILLQALLQDRRDKFGTPVDEELLFLND